MSKFLLFVSALCCTLYAYASDFMVDGLNYTILSDNEVEVSGFSSASISSPMYKSEILEIPSEVTNKGITYIVTSIGYSAFSVARSGNAYMGNFNKIVIPSSIKTIGDYAFYMVDRITKVEFSEGLTSIGNFSFASTGITNVQFPSSLEALGTSAFSGSKLENLSINCANIGNNAFYTTPIRSVQFGENVKYINDNAFNGCQQLTVLEIPGTVSYIGKNTFGRCKNIKSLRILDGTEPLSLCNSSFQFAENVISNGTGVFGEGYEDDSALESIFIARQYKAADSSQTGFFLSNGSNLTELTLAGSLKDILPNSFCRFPKLNKLIVPTHIKTISYSSFRYCPSLIEWEIMPDANNSLTFTKDGSTSNGAVWSMKFATIGRQIEAEDSNCGTIFPLSLESVLFNGSFTNINNATTLAGHNNLTNIDFQCNLQSICDNAFTGTSIQNVALPNSLTTIGLGAFKNCKQLISLQNSNNVLNIPEQVFDGCIKLSSIHIGDKVETVSSQAFFGCISLENIEFTNALQTISQQAFWYCSGLKTVHLGNNVKSINGFSCCENLEAFYIPSIEAWLKIEEPNSLAYPYSLYVNGELYEHLIVPDNIHKINDYAFKGCSSLKTADLNQISSCGYFAFDDCINLETIISGNQLRTFPIPQNVSSLKELTLGSNIKDIWGSYQYQLEKITCLSSIPPTIYGTTFSDATYDNALLTVPYGAMSDYKSASGWRNFINVKEEEAPFVAIEQLILSPTNLRLKKEDASFISATALPSNASNQSLLWKSDDENVVVVDGNGEVKAVGVGYTTITATTTDGSNLSATCSVEVYEPTILVTSITITPNIIVGKPGENIQLTIEVAPKDATDKSVTLSSENPGIASVGSDGLVSLLAEGNTIIRATSNDGTDITATCTVQISDDSGIDDIKVESSEFVKIFNLQGVLVYEGKYSEAHLAHGMYITVSQNNIIKRIIH